MASTQSKSAKASATRSDGESARWIFGLLLLFAGIFLVASVVFYYFDWRGDYSALHGIGSDALTWQGVLDRLPHAIAWDAPGYGASPPVAAGQTTAGATSPGMTAIGV